ncbi:Rho GTPase-activating protein 15 [Astathelohania contejeani]|uniref:Rho GTPase-activating protein 15 n=1 Tax=Astathelohania contejeani TaxID=164912 RepID=A0ABQ7HY57_9MICR|nr:Rho GTPase-activating protein 15 [Thelohania contejeani]
MVKLNLENQKQQKQATMDGMISDAFGTTQKQVLNTNPQFIDGCKNKISEHIKMFNKRECNEACDVKQIPSQESPFRNMSAPLLDRNSSLIEHQKKDRSDDYLISKTYNSEEFIKTSQSFMEQRENSFAITSDPILNASVFEDEISTIITNEKRKSKRRRKGLKYQKKDGCIEYSTLNPLDKIRLSKFCIRQIRSKHKKAFLKRLIDGIKKMCVKDKKENEATICPFIYEIIDHIRKNGLNCQGIFRIGGDVKEYTRLTEMLANGNSFELDKVDIYTITSTLKMYVREVLDGLIPVQICDPLYYAYTTRDEELQKEMLKYLPFVFSEPRRKLLLEIFNLLIEIDANSTQNKMTLDNLLRILLPTLFPLAATKELSILVIQKDILFKMLDLDYENVPQSYIKRE